MTIRFAAIGLDHRHIYDQVGGLLGWAAECAGYWTEASRSRCRASSSAFRTWSGSTTGARCSKTRRSTDRRPPPSPATGPARDRGDAPRQGRHDRQAGLHDPGPARRASAVQAETGRIWSVYFSERFEVRRTVTAGELVRGRRHRQGRPDRRPRAAPPATAPRARPGSSSASATAASCPTSPRTSSTSSSSSPARPTPRSSRAGRQLRQPGRPGASRTSAR